MLLGLFSIQFGISFGQTNTTNKISIDRDTLLSMISDLWKSDSCGCSCKTRILIADYLSHSNDNVLIGFSEVQINQLFGEPVRKIKMENINSWVYPTCGEIINGSKKCNDEEGFNSRLFGVLFDNKTNKVISVQHVFL